MTVARPFSQEHYAVVHVLTSEDVAVVPCRAAGHDEPRALSLATRRAVGSVHAGQGSSVPRPALVSPPSPALCASSDYLEARAIAEPKVHGHSRQDAENQPDSGCQPLPAGLVVTPFGVVASSHDHHLLPAKVGA